MNPVLSIVVPVFNSAECLQELARRIAENLHELHYELILVDDYSEDNSWNEIVTICNQYKGITGISLRKNCGQDNAIMAGLQRVKGEYVVIMDDDLQHDPADIPALYQKCSEGFDVCYGMFDQKKQKGWKNIGSFINNKLSERTLSKPKGIYLSPFKVFRTKLVTEMLNYKGPFPYIDALLLSATKNITQLQVAHNKRYKGHSNFNFAKSLAVFLNHTVSHSIYPLRMVVYLAVILNSFTLIFFIYTVIRFLAGNKIDKINSILLVILFLGSIIMFCLAIVGEYLARTFLTINQTPQYSIDKVIISKDDHA